MRLCRGLFQKAGLMKSLARGNPGFLSVSSLLLSLMELYDMGCPFLVNTINFEAEINHVGKKTSFYTRG